MTRQTFLKRARELYDNRMDIFGSDISFSLTYMDRDNGERRNVCVGTWGELALLCMAELQQLYIAGKKEGMTEEEFADMVHDMFTRYVKENPAPDVKLKTFGGD